MVGWDFLWSEFGWVRLVAWSPGGTRKHFLARLKATGQQMPVSDEWLEGQMKREWTAHPFGLPKANPSMHCFSAFLERGGGGQVMGGGGRFGRRESLTQNRRSAAAPQPPPGKLSTPGRLHWGMRCHGVLSGQCCHSPKLSGVLFDRSCHP